MQKFVGIEIGNYAVKVIVGQGGKQGEKFSIIGSSAKQSRGISKGSIIDKYKINKSIHRAVDAAERDSETTIESVYVAINGTHITSISKTGEILTHNKRRITEIEIEQIKNSVQEEINLEYPNYTNIYQVPISYTLDDTILTTSPTGLIMKEKLTITYFTVMCFSQHLESIQSSVEDVGVTIEDFIPGPIANSLVTLTEEQKETGCILVDIGSQTTSILIYDEGHPSSLKVFPIGSNNITNEIAINLQVPLKDAESIKMGVVEHEKYKEIQKITENTLKKIFKLIDEHLEEINKSHLLPGGVVISGGSAGLTSINNISTSILKLPTQVIDIKEGEYINKLKLSIHNSAWASVYGAAYFGMLEYRINESLLEISVRKTTHIFRKTIALIKRSLT